LIRYASLNRDAENKMVSNEPFQKVEDEYFRLKGQLAAGRITSEQFNTALNDLMIEHEGRWWMIGADSGKWYVHDGKNWLESVPPVISEEPKPDTRRRNPSTTTQPRINRGDSVASSITWGVLNVLGAPFRLLGGLVLIFGSAGILALASIGVLSALGTDYNSLGETTKGWLGLIFVLLTMVVVSVLHSTWKAIVGKILGSLGPRLK